MWYTARAMADVVIIGSGPNGLVAAAHLGRAGYDVTVLEAASEPGGAVRTHEATLPGYRHDVGAAFFPFGAASRALVELDLPGAGLVWKHAAFDSAHPALDGTSAAITRDPARLEEALGADAPAWEKLTRWYKALETELLDVLLSTFPPVKAGLRIAPWKLLPLVTAALSSGRGFASARFTTEAARRMLPALALHTDVGPDDDLGAIIGFMLAMTASSGGFAVPEGGAGAITDALLVRLAEHRTRVVVSDRVVRIDVEHGRAVRVRCASGAVHEARHAVLADTAPDALYLDLLDHRHVPASIRDRMRAFDHGFATFKVDWALAGPVPWRDALSREAAVVHTGESLDDLARFTREVRSGALPTLPYLVIGQQSIVDPTRAPAGGHTLYAYSRVPAAPAGGWDAHRERFADRIEDRIEGLAPGFKKIVRARVILDPGRLERMNDNLRQGDITGGSAGIQNQLFLRPFFPYFRYRTPVRGLYLGSAYTHPGAGVHGACGYNAAKAILEDTA